MTGNEFLWLFGQVDGYAFAAKVYDDSSTFGIDNGRVSKLGLYQGDREVVDYERGWCKYPGDTDLEDTMEALLLFLAKVPLWEHWSEIRRNVPHIIELKERKRTVIM